MSIVLHSRVFNFLMAFREKHPDFICSLRQKNNNNKLNEGYWFQGNGEYAFLGLYKKSGGTNMTRSFGLVFFMNGDKIKCHIENVFDNEKDEETLKCYESIRSMLGGFEKKYDTKYIKKLTGDGLKEAELFLIEEKPKIDKLIRDRGLDDFFITKEEFQKYLNRILEIMKNKQNEKSNFNSHKQVNTHKTNSYNLILTGAPGTGKTYLAKKMANELIGVDSEDFSKQENNICFVQFHPSYDYTDFVEGLRPVPSESGSNQIVFERKDGIFKEFCKRALADTNHSFVFIIDEINRGEISKIFGELFFSIDPGYRGKKGLIKTQYQNLIPEDDPFYNGFYVPENVYIIGTMNDIDRSVENMDFAIRRRFAWQELSAKDRVSMWDGNIDPWKEDATIVMDALNVALADDGFSTAYHVGPAYFLKLEEYEGDFQKLWDCHIKGVLFEYVRGLSDATDKMERFENSFFKALNA